MDILGWLARYFRADYNKGTGEAVFPCPQCQHPMFYFNVRKKLGYCHHDRCHWKCNLDDLIEKVGHGPEDALSGTFLPEPEPDVQVEVSFPEGAEKLVDMSVKIGKKWIIPKPWACGEIERKRGVTIDLQYQFDLHMDVERIYIPVYLEGKMVSYVGRRIWWMDYDYDALRYKYPTGNKVTNYLFNWDEAKTWKELTLVENTFNGIWLRDLQATSNFGSNLSDKQIQLIQSGRARSVVLLWDEGAGRSAEKAVTKLRAKGINASSVQITGQPDDHTKPRLEYLIQLGHENAKKRKLKTVWIHN